MNLFKPPINDAKCRSEKIFLKHKCPLTLDSSFDSSNSYCIFILVFHVGTHIIEKPLKGLHCPPYHIPSILTKNIFHTVHRHGQTDTSLFISLHKIIKIGSNLQERLWPKDAPPNYQKRLTYLT